MIRRDPDELVVPVRAPLELPEDLGVPRPMSRPVFRENRLLERLEFHPMAGSRVRIRKLFRLPGFHTAP